MTTIFVEWNLENFSPIIDLDAHERLVKRVEWSRDGHRIVSGGDDRYLIVWDAENFIEINRIPVERPNMDYTLTTDGTHVIIQSETFDLRFINLETGETARELSGHTASVTDVAVSDDARYMLSGSEDTQIFLWNLQTGEIIREYVGNIGDISELEFTDDGATFLSLSGERDVSVWETVPPSLESLFQWIEENRVVRNFTPVECERYNVDCD